MKTITKLIREIENEIKKAVSIANRNEFGFSIYTQLGETILEAEKKDIPTNDNALITDILTIKTIIPKKKYTLDFKKINKINRLLSLSGLYYDSIIQNTVLSNRLTIYNTDDEIWNIYKKLIIYIIKNQANEFVKMNNMIDENQIERETIKSNHWNKIEYENAYNLLKSCNLISYYSETGMSAEFPWNEGNKTVLTDHKTCLFTCKNINHAILGDGIKFTLELPINVNEGKKAIIANAFNKIEQTAIEAPPSFGSWCFEKGKDHMIFHGFLPNALYWKGSIGNLAIWLLFRSKIFKQVSDDILGNN